MNCEEKEKISKIYEKKIKPELLEKAIEEYKKTGVSAFKVYKNFGVSPATLFQELEKRGIKKKSKSDVAYEKISSKISPELLNKILLGEVKLKELRQITGIADMTLRKFFRKYYKFSFRKKEVILSDEKLNEAPEVQKK